jgi:hypothetical protein
MEEEKSPNETVDVYDPQAKSSPTFGSPDARQPSIAKWPTEPKPLKRGVLSETIYTFLDILMCLAPVALLIKAGLVVLASRRDMYVTGSLDSPPSALTLNLIRFNTQVCKLQLSITAVLLI